MQIKTDEVKYNVSANTYTRGRDYYAQDMVIKCIGKVNTDNKIILQGTVLGSYQNDYTQFINIFHIGNRVKLDGGCTCPVGYNCKHVVAVCLKYIEQEKSLFRFVENEPKDLVTEWLDDFNSSKKSVTKAYEKAKNDYFITYRLFGSARNRYKDQLQFYKSKYLKNKKLSAGTLLQDYKFTTPYYNQDIKDDADKQIAKSADNLEFGSYNSSMKFEGRFGAMLLQDIIQTGRAYLRL